MTTIRPTMVQVRAPARLHMGFLDLGGGLDRRFGSLGMGIEEICVDLAAEPAGGVSAAGPGAARAEDCARRLLEHLHLKAGVSIEIARAIPEHAGLGSGTQMALAVGTAISRLYGLALEPEAIAAILGRGNRSGIGIGTFRQGGFIVDGGRGVRTSAPPVVSRLPVPDAWRCLLVLVQGTAGLSGTVEQEAFARLEPMNQGMAARICHVVLMQVLPALAEQDCPAFGEGISAIQALMGEYFAPIQNGPFCSEAVSGVLSMLRRHGACGIGQSSWGPSGFALFASETDAFQALKHARDSHCDGSGLEFVLCRATNAPAPVLVQDPIIRGARRV